MKMIIMSILVLLLGLTAVAAAPCDGFQGTADAVFYQNMELGGRQASIYKTDPTINICNYDNFCERMGLEWYAPQSGSEADDTLTAVRAIDDWHTWIISKAPTVMGSPGQARWNGRLLSTADSPGCSDGSTEGFSAIRDWGCSMCDPEMYNSTRCWDSDHQYDWIICEADDGGSDDDTPNEIPEFGVLAAGVALIGALAIFAFKRK